MVADTLKKIVTLMNSHEEDMSLIKAALKVKDDAKRESLKINKTAESPSAVAKRNAMSKIIELHELEEMISSDSNKSEGKKTQGKNKKKKSKSSFKDSSFKSSSDSGKKSSISSKTSDSDINIKIKNGES